MLYSMCMKERCSTVKIPNKYIQIPATGHIGTYIQHTQIYLHLCTKTV